MKLHLGCGKRHIPGFVHIDAVDYPHVDHVATIDNLSFIQDASVDLIYNCHVLEHFKRREVGRVLKEWHRVLKPGGILRISVPDFAKLCEVYQKYGQLDLVIGALFGRQDYLYNIHYNVFDFATLKRELESAGSPTSVVMTGGRPNMPTSTIIPRPTFPTWTRKTGY
jgi:predicted SAM-dependent methyltransferase